MSLTDSLLLSLMAPDRPGIVSRIATTIGHEGWTIGHAWAEAKGGTFFMAVELKTGKRPLDAEIDTFKTSLRHELSAEISITDLQTEFSPENTDSDFVAEIFIEGTRRFAVLSEVSSVMARESATIVSIRTEVIDGKSRYALHAMYDAPIQQNLLAALASLSSDVDFDFIPANAEIAGAQNSPA